MIKCDDLNTDNKGNMKRRIMRKIYIVVIVKK